MATSIPQSEWTQEQKRAYWRQKAKEWRLNNPERSREIKRAEYQRNKERHATTVAKWVRANPEKRKAIVKRYRERHREEYLQRTRERCREYYRKNKDRRKQYNQAKGREWRLKNRAKLRVEKRVWKRKKRVSLALERLRAELLIVSAYLKRSPHDENSQPAKVRKRNRRARPVPAKH